MADFLETAIASIGLDPRAGVCGECGYAWATDPHGALRRVEAAPDRFADLLEVEGADPYRPRRPLTWSASAYTWHVSDVLRAWAERGVALDAEPERPLVGFGQDELAQVRGYDRLAVTAGLWALEGAAADLVAVTNEIGVGVAFTHPDWGSGTFGDGLVWVGHEVVHHELDVKRSVAESG